MSKNLIEIALKIAASDVITNIVHQMQPYGQKHAEYLKKLTGKSWRFAKYATHSEGNNIVVFKWIPLLQAEIGDNEMYGLKIEYDIGSDTYNVTAFYVTKEGQVNWGKKMDDIYFDQFGDSSIMFHHIELPKPKPASTINYMPSGFIKTLEAQGVLVYRKYEEFNKMGDGLLKELQKGVHDDNLKYVQRMIQKLEIMAIDLSNLSQDVAKTVKQEADTITYLG